MKKWNLREFIENFTEIDRADDIGDNIAIFYKESKYPIKINEKIEPKLKYFKASFCTYDLSHNVDIKTFPAEMIAIEDYSDSPYSIYIDEKGNINSYEFEKINNIEIGGIVLEIKENKVIGVHTALNSDNFEK